MLLLGLLGLSGFRLRKDVGMLVKLQAPIACLGAQHI